MTIPREKERDEKVSSVTTADRMHLTIWLIPSRIDQLGDCLIAYDCCISFFPRGLPFAKFVISCL